MEFLKSELGAVTGLEKDAFGDFSLIPDDTLHIASIDSMVIKEYMGEKYYNITWRIVSTDYNNRVVFQKLKCFSSDAKVKHRALNQLLLLANICNFKHSFNYAPNDVELLAIVGRKAQIKVRVWEQNDKSGNYVAEFSKYEELPEDDVPF